MVKNAKIIRNLLYLTSIGAGLGMFLVVFINSALVPIPFICFMLTGLLMILFPSKVLKLNANYFKLKGIKYFSNNPTNLFFIRLTGILLILSSFVLIFVNK